MERNGNFRRPTNVAIEEEETVASYIVAVVAWNGRIASNNTVM